VCDPSVRSQVEAHYTRGNLLGLMLDALRSAGLDPDHLDPEALAPLEEFHTLGREATVALAEAAGVVEGEEVLDVGCGVGGPARLLARAFGARVTGIDTTQEFCTTAVDLNARTGLSGRIDIEQGDALALPFPDAAFDVVWTQHVSMNIADKARFYQELRRVVRRGGRLAFFDIVAGPNQPLHFPVPWSETPALSFLVPAEEVRRLVEEAGFSVQRWEDTSAEAMSFFEQLTARTAGPGGLPALGIHVLIRDFATKAANARRNLAEDRIRLLRAVCAAR
jgi:MPBQ/MSBQ methyltransferase